MKLSLFFLFILSYATSFSQVLSGTAIDEGRICTTPNPVFDLSCSQSGTIIIEVSIARNGAVLSSKVLKDGTTISSTPCQMEAKNAAKKLSFTAGNGFSKFQYAQIKYSITK